MNDERFRTMENMVAERNQRWLDRQPEPRQPGRRKRLTSGMTRYERDAFYAGNGNVITAAIVRTAR